MPNCLIVLEIMAPASDTLVGLAGLDHRLPTEEVEWLIEQEAERRRAAVRPLVQAIIQDSGAPATAAPATPARSEPASAGPSGDQRMGKHETDDELLSADVSKALKKRLDRMEAIVIGPVRRGEAINAAVYLFCLLPPRASLNAMRDCSGRDLYPEWNDLTE